MKPSAASLYQAAELIQDLGPLIIGERSNTNGSKKFREHLLADEFDACLAMGMQQEADGAHMVDLCAAYAGRDEKADMEKLVRLYAESVKIPIVIDSTTPEVIESCLRLYPGRAIVNSINLEDGGVNIRKVCPMLKKYGAATVALTINVEGMAMDADKKVAVAKEIYDIAVGEFELRPQDLLFDALTFTIGAGDETLRDAATQTIEAIRRIKGAFSVLQAGWLVSEVSSRQREYTASVDRLLVRLANVQLSDGSVPLFSEEEIPAEPSAAGALLTHGYANPTAGLAVLAHEYEALTGDDRHRPAVARALDYLVDVFTPEHGFRTATNANRLNSTDGFSLYALHAWSGSRPDVAALVDSATEYILHGELWNAEEQCWKFGFGVQDGFDLEAVPHPTLDFTRMWALFMVHGDRYAESIRQSIDAALRHFDRLESFYNRDGYRFGDVRIRTGLPAVMALYDHHTGSQTFTATDTFRELVQWTLDMYDPAISAFREQHDLRTGAKRFSGLPAQFLAQYLFACGIVNRDVPGAHPQGDMIGTT